jgi:methionine synthase I (cobalamin-dependent)/5,10-methylenetetrahydrofolate reductase
MTRSFADRLADGRVHIIDGAMGTMLYSQGVFVHVCYDELNISQPDLVRGIHADYRQAGAEILETNTFGANPVKLSSFGLEDRTEELNEAAARLARDVAGDALSVIGAMGPLGIRIEPFGPTGREEAEALFGRQVDGLLRGDVDGFILETFADQEELATALRAVRLRCDLPVIAQMTVGETGVTAYGTDVQTIARRLTELGADVVGLNCAVGPAAMLDAIELMAAATERPLSAQPNAGLPREVGDRKIYLASPEYMARYARRFIEAGVRFVGGCCGTTPEHIRRIRDQVATVQPRRSGTVVARAEVRAPEGVAPAALEERSAWGTRLARGEFVISVETLPPRGWRADPLLADARAAREAGADAIALLDTPRAEGRMAVLPAAALVEREAGIETVVHYTCRDRNMLGMMSDLLGAGALGLRNLLLVTGDAPTMGPYPDATAVFDIDSIGLTNVAYRLNHGLDAGGNPIGEPTRFVIGVAVNHTAGDLDRELRRFYWKVDAGADFAITQPVFDPEAFAGFLKRVEEYRLPILASVWPLTSLRNAEFLANEVPGVQVPSGVLERMRAAQARGSGATAAEGLHIATEVMDALRPLVAGFQIVAPFGDLTGALTLVRQLRG